MQEPLILFTWDCEPFCTQFLFLGLVTDLLNLAVDVVVATFAEPIGQKLRASYRFRQGQRITSGSTLIGLGAYIAVVDQK